MSVVSQYLETYPRQIDFFRNLATHAHQLLEEVLNSESISADVESRVKGIQSLDSKLRNRERQRVEEGTGMYPDFAEIENDIVDLADFESFQYS